MDMERIIRRAYESATASRKDIVKRWHDAEDFSDLCWSQQKTNHPSRHAPQSFATQMQSQTSAAWMVAQKCRIFQLGTGRKG